MESFATQEVTAELKGGVWSVWGTKLEAELEVDYEDQGCEYCDNMQRFFAAQAAQHPSGHPHGGFSVFVNQASSLREAVPPTRLTRDLVIRKNPNC
jgi:hypothetical protein